MGSGSQSAQLRADLLEEACLPPALLLTPRVPCVPVGQLWRWVTQSAPPSSEGV